MISDVSALGGLQAYIVERPGRTKLRPGDIGMTATVPEGELWNVSAVDLIVKFEGDPVDILDRPGQVSADPLFVLSAEKEMFPKYFADPFSSRVYNLSGEEQLRAGAMDGWTILRVNDVATLTPVGQNPIQNSRWLSARFRHHAPVDIRGVAWGLGISRDYPSSLLEYDVTLHYWTSGDESLSLATRKSVVLTSSPHFANSDRASALELQNVAGMQFEFNVHKLWLGDVAERSEDLKRDLSSGVPLLQSLSVIESIESVHEIRSLNELLSRCSDYFVHSPTAEYRTVHATYSISATLLPGESIRVEVLSDEVRWVEARLDAVVRRRRLPSLSPYEV